MNLQAVWSFNGATQHATPIYVLLILSLKLYSGRKCYVYFDLKSYIIHDIIYILAVRNFASHNRTMSNNNSQFASNTVTALYSNLLKDWFPAQVAAARERGT